MIHIPISNVVHTNNLQRELRIRPAVTATRKTQSKKTSTKQPKKKKTKTPVKRVKRTKAPKTTKRRKYKLRHRD